MQNQLNLMSSFEFIAALMSIIIGLGVTNLLAGIARALYRRVENPLDEVRTVLSRSHAPGAASELVGHVQVEQGRNLEF